MTADSADPRRSMVGRVHVATGVSIWCTSSWDHVQESTREARSPPLRPRRCKKQRDSEHHFVHGWLAKHILASFEIRETRFSKSMTMWAQVRPGNQYRVATPVLEGSWPYVKLGFRCLGSVCIVRVKCFRGPKTNSQVGGLSRVC